MLYFWFSILSGPLLAHMPEDSNMIAIEVASPFLIPFKLTLFLAVFLAIPYVLYQLWSFVAPGLYKNEKSFAFPLLGSSIMLFYAGIAFAYFVVFPLIFGFMTAVEAARSEMRPRRFRSSSQPCFTTTEEREVDSFSQIVMPCSSCPSPRTPLSSRIRLSFLLKLTILYPISYPARWNVRFRSSGSSVRLSASS